MVWKKFLKAIDIRPEQDAYRDKQGKPRPFVPFLAVLVIVLSIALACALFFRAQGGEGQGTIGLFTEGSYFAGEEIIVRAYSSCGKFSLFVDGREIADGEGSIRKGVALEKGRHEILAKNGKCSAMLQVAVSMRECGGNEMKGCVEGGCNGTQECLGGKWGECAMPRRVCTPGTTTGCSVDSCRFGYATCNGCGTGFSECLPQGNDTQSECGSDCT